ncbi:MAG: MerR family transcriptional regulator [candidate division KSB1 bacterium]|nr:MerR family transcriptional regulator [candidate division KSB1 bacterium]
MSSTNTKNPSEERYYTSAEIIKEVNISLRQLYYWELKGIVKPKLITLGTREFKRYSPKDLEIMKKLKQFLDEGYTLKSAVQKVQNSLR